MKQADHDLKYEWDRLHEAVVRRGLSQIHNDMQEALAVYWIVKFLRWGNQCTDQAVTVAPA